MEEMPPKVKKAGGKYLDSPFFPLYNLLPEPPIVKTHPGAWEMESPGVSRELQSSAGEEGLDGMDLVETNPGLAQSTPFTIQHSFSPFQLYLITSWKHLSSTNALSFFPLTRGIENTVSHYIHLRSKIYR